MTIQANFPAIKPALLLDFQNTKQLDSRITYTRASTASYYDGVTTSKAEENLLLRSQELDNASAWSQTTGIGTPTANSTTAPDGTTTADTITCSATTSAHRIGQSVTMAAADHAVSVYAKAGTHNFIQFSIGNQSVHANFNITSGAGATGTSSGITSSSITDVGSGWYRCTMIYTNTVGNTINVYLVSGASVARNESWTAVGTETVYLWGAQVEQRSAVTAYTATTTQAITNYIPKLQSAASGVARFDNNPTTGESLGLLIEESRTNLFTYSEQFDNAVWTKQSSTITANAIVSPDGSLDGEKLDETTANDTHRLEHNLTTVNGTVYTLSVFAKAAERQWVYLFEDSATNACTFNLATGAVGTTQGSVTASISSVGNGWYRCSLTYTQSGTTGRMRISVANGTSTLSYTGVANNGIFIWGAQLEAGAFATSYIPTVASQVTRAADSASMTGTNFSTWFNQGEGTMYADWVGAANGATLARISFNNDASNRIDITSGTSSNLFYSIALGATQAGIGTRIQSGKAAGAYKFNDFAVSGNGSAVSTDTSGLVPIVNQFELQSGANATIKKFAYYPLRLSNTNLVALTS